MGRSIAIKYLIITVLCMIFSGFWSGMILSGLIFAISEFLFPRE